MVDLGFTSYQVEESVGSQIPGLIREVMDLIYV